MEPARSLIPFAIAHLVLSDLCCKDLWGLVSEVVFRIVVSGVDVEMEVN